MIYEIAVLATAIFFCRALLQFTTGSMQWRGLLSAGIRVKKKKAISTTKQRNMSFSLPAILPHTQQPQKITL